MNKPSLFVPDKEDEVSSLVKKCVTRVCNASKRLPFYAIGIYFICLFLSVGLLSIFKGQPFTNLLVFGIPVQEAWAKTDSGLLYTCIFGSAIIAVIISILYYSRVLTDFNGILMEDCEGYEYLVVSKYGINHSVNYASEVAFQAAYATALCIHGKFDEALEFVKPFESDKRKRKIWLNVKLNIAKDNAEFDYYYNQLRKKGLFEIVKLYRDGKYDETVKFIRDNIDMKPSYEAAIGSFYMAKAYEALHSYEEAFVAVSGCIANSEYLPYLNEKANELYARLSKVLFDNRRIETSANPDETSANPDEWVDAPIDIKEISDIPDDIEEISIKVDTSDESVNVDEVIDALNNFDETSSKSDETSIESGKPSAKPDAE